MNTDFFNNKRIFISGGTGFFGKSILDMIDRGFFQHSSFTILSRNPEQFKNAYPRFAALKNVDFIAGDVCNFPFPEPDFDYIIHAATPAVTTLAPGEMSKIILGGMHHILDMARRCTSARLLFTSSGAVYGVQEPDCLNISEEHDCRPLTEYGIAKLEAENMCRFSQVDTVIARCFAFVGPHLNKNIHFAIGNFMRDASLGNDIIIQGDGTPFRSYLYADDLVEWLFAILQKGETMRPYNVGSPYGLSISDLANTVAGVFSPRPAVKIMMPPVQGLAPTRYVPDVSRITGELGVSIKTELVEAIKKSL